MVRMDSPGGEIVAVARSGRIKGQAEACRTFPVAFAGPAESSGHQPVSAFELPPDWAHRFFARSRGFWMRSVSLEPLSELHVVSNA